MCLRILDPMIELTEREIQVVAAIIKIYYGNRNTDVESVSKALSTRRVKKNIETSLNMSANTLNNIVMRLRKKGVLEGYKVRPALLKLYPDKSARTEIVYKLTIVPVL